MTAYKVTEGFTVSTKRGPVKAGKPVAAADFTHGEKAISDLLDKGHIVKDEPAKKATKK